MILQVIKFTSYTHKILFAFILSDGVTHCSCVMGQVKTEVNCFLLQKHILYDFEPLSFVFFWG